MPLAAIFGVTFLSPLGALFSLAAAIPLVALLHTERRGREVRSLLGVGAQGRRALTVLVTALVLLPLLVGVAAAQPVVVRRQLVRERGDTQAFFVFDTSRSMLASSGPDRPSRLARAERIALGLDRALGDVPVGIASMTDRTLPDLMPTVDRSLFAHTLSESVGIDEPPPDRPYGGGRSTTLMSLVPVATARFYSPSVGHRLLVVFTDGEAQPLTATVLGRLGPLRGLSPIFVHVWAREERIFEQGGRPDPHYSPDPRSSALLAAAARATGGSAFGERQLGSIEAQARRVVGQRARSARVGGYARVALAPWLVLAGIAPLAVLLWFRNA
jgi:hypothetical protein